MNTNPQPATPLPLRIDGVTIGPLTHLFRVWTANDGNREAFILQFTSLTPEKNRQDAEYIVHAANAYPELVGALQGLFEHCVMLHKRWGEGCNLKEADAAQDTARALLAKLGEAS